MLKNLSRLTKEFKFLAETPGPGISASPADGNILELYASVTGPEDSPYANGLFRLKLNLPENYPFEPPKAQFITPIYHPNIDSEGRICLDTLKPQPQGSWSPSITLNTLLLSIRLLLMHPNAEDGLVPDITELFKRDYAAYKRNAAQHTAMHAIVTTDLPDPSKQTNIENNVLHDTNNNMSSNTADTLMKETCDNEYSPDNTHDQDVNLVDTIQEPVELEYERKYEYIADGYTLIGCNPGSQGQILRLELNVSSESTAVNSDTSTEVAAAPTQQQLEEDIAEISKSIKRQRRKS